MDKPIIFLTFANEQQPDGRYLKNVVKEEKQLKEILEPISSQGGINGPNTLCNLKVISNVNLDEIIKVLNDYKDQDMIFHFGGHAAPDKLILEKDDGSGSIQYVKAEGLVPILSDSKKLKLVFLNGCSTKRIARQLVKNGIMAVIGTSSSIPDTLALKVSKHFYTALADGKTMAGAWELAKNVAAALGDEDSDSRGIKLEEEGAWDVEFKDDAAKEVFNKWNLPDTANNPLYKLPQPPKRVLPNDSPFLFLESYKEKHAEIFFGRSFYIRDLWLKITEPVSPSLILLYGESGTGKSSLLDAGLVPRLKASGKGHFKNYPKFEVRYEPREQDKSLVETLAHLLNYTSESEVEHRIVKAVPADDLENLEKIESIVKQLKKEEVKEDLLNIVDLHRSLQKEPSPPPLPVGLYTADGLLIEDAGLKLRQAWKTFEQKEGKRLIIILDQVEELFTTPHKHQPNELADLLEVIKEIFAITSDNPADKIEGKIILGYRAEYNPRIEARIKEKELARSTVFLEPLDKKGIKDVFEGLQKGRVAKEYNIQIEKGLPDKIADYLLKGQGAVAPILQFLLVRLWKHAHPLNPNSPDFSIPVFQKVSSGNQEMEEYLDQQMKLVHKDKRSVVESGLVLDILKFHTSSRGTSVAKKIDSIIEEYVHIKKEEIIELVKLLKEPDIFLLKDRNDGYTSLPHDTLAPVIIRKYNESDKPGQRAARILDAKVTELERLSPEEKDKVLLDENDLKVVQNGRKGMRALYKKGEEDLLTRSKEDLKNRIRRRRTLVKGGIVAGLFIMILSLFAGSMTLSMTDQVNNAVAVRAHEAALLELDKSPEPSPLQAEAAIQMAQFAYRENNPKRLDIVKNLYSLYDQFQGLKPLFLTFDTVGLDTLNRFVALSTPARISSLRFFPGQGAVASLEGSKISYWPESRGKSTPKIIDLNDDINDLKTPQVDFSADRKNIQIISREDRQPLYWLNNTLVPSLRVSVYPPFDSLSSNTDSLGTYDLFTGQFLAPVLGISLSKEDFLDAYALKIDSLGYRDRLQLMIKYGDWSGQITVDDLFSIQLINETENYFDHKIYERLQEQITPLPLLPVDTSDNRIRATNLTRAIHNKVLIWDTQKIGSKPDPIFLDTTALYYISALTDSTLLTVDTSGRAEIRKTGELNSTGRVVKVLKEGDTSLVDIAISPDQQYILALTKQDDVFLWDVEGEKVDSFSHAKLKSYAFATKGSDLMTLSADSVCIWSSTASTRVFHRPENAPPISFARFHQGKPEENDEYLVIGLALPPVIDPVQKSGRLERLKFWKKKNKPLDAQVVLWNIRQEKDSQTIPTNTPILLDATASQDLQWIVALQTQQASIIPNSSKGIIKNQSETELSGAQNSAQVSKVEISPGGNFIVRRSEQDRKVELFSCEGQLINVYSFQDGFRQGFNNQLFSSDDHFMIGSKSDEVLFWQPESEKEGKVIQWAKQFELPLDQKQQEGIDTFMDYIPGSRLAAKWWAIAIILSALIFILLYFSEYALSFISQRNYVTLLLYFVGFSSLVLYLIALWVSDPHNLFFKRAIFYAIVTITLITVVGGLINSFARQKTAEKNSILISLGAIALFILMGTVQFFIYESPNNQENFGNETTKFEYELIRVYQQHPDLFHELYGKGEDANAINSSNIDRLELSELKKIHAEYPENFVVAAPISSKWAELSTIGLGLLLLGVFWFLMGRPIYRAVKFYEEEKMISYYDLLLPVVCLSFAAWIIYTMIFQDYNGITVNMLAIFFCLFIIWKSWHHFIFNGYFFLRLSIFVLYFILTFFSYPIPLGYSFLPIALVATFLLGGFYSKYVAPPYKVFLLYCGTILLGTGALVWGFNDIEGDFVSAIFAPIYAAFLVFIFYKMKSLLDSISLNENKIDRWINRLYILGIWLLGLLLTNAYLAIVSIDYEEASLNNKDQSSIKIESIGQNMGAPDPNIIPIDTNEFTEITSLVETDTLRSLPNQLQQLVNKLFEFDPSIQDNALDRLSTQYRGAPGLVEMLIQAHDQHPELADRTVNVLFLLETQSDEYLKDQEAAILPFLEEVENTDNQERIDKLRERIKF